MLSKDYLEKFLQPYRLVVDDATFLRYGQNYVYSCQRAGKKCIIRISKDRHRSKAEVEAELSWVLFMVERGIKACAPIPAENGDLCTTFEFAGETYLVTCFEHAPGHEIARHDVAEHFYEQLGRFLGRMHAEAASFNFRQISLARPNWHDSRLLQKDFTEKQECLTEKFRASVADLIQQLSNIPKTDNAHGLIHGDISFGNIFIHEGELWLIDFDNCEHGYFLQDLGIVLW